MNSAWCTKEAAVLTIDCQVDICRAAGRFAGPISAQLADGVALNAIARVQRAARNSGIPLLHVRHTLDEYAGPEAPRLLRGMQRAGGCRRGSPGMEIVSEVAPKAAELVIDKERISAFAGTTLDRWLRTNRVRTLLVTGVSTTYAIEGTARDAVDRGYRVLVSPETSVCITESDHHRSLRGPLTMLATVASVDNVTAWLGGEVPGPTVWTGAEHG